jgi:ankyrin repeat protein
MNDAAVVRFLLEYGAGTALVVDAGESVLHRACRIPANDERSFSYNEAIRLDAVSLVIISLLLDNGAGVEARNGKGRKPLSYTLQGCRRGDHSEFSREAPSSSGNSRKSINQAEVYSIAAEVCD